MEKKNWKAKSKQERNKNSIPMEMNCTFLLLLFWSFPKYQYINKHEKQLVIHKAFGSSVVIRANWSGSTNAEDGNSSVVWTNLNGWKTLKLQRWSKPCSTAGSRLSSACRKWQKYYKFPAQSELFQSPVKTSLVK